MRRAALNFIFTIPGSRGARGIKAQRTVCYLTVSVHCHCAACDPAARAECVAGGGRERGVEIRFRVRKSHPLGPVPTARPSRPRFPGVFPRRPPPALG